VQDSGCDNRGVSLLDGSGRANTLLGRTRGRPLTTTSVRQQLRRTAAKAGVRRRFAPHQLRHAHAVEMAS
jgi:site-specific recombinase XerD